MLDILKNKYNHYCCLINDGIINLFIIIFYNLGWIWNTSNWKYKDFFNKKKYKKILKKNTSINNLIDDKNTNNINNTIDNSNLCEWGWFIFIDN